MCTWGGGGCVCGSIYIYMYVNLDVIEFHVCMCCVCVCAWSPFSYRWLRSVHVLPGRYVWCTGMLWILLWCILMLLLRKRNLWVCWYVNSSCTLGSVVTNSIKRLRDLYVLTSGTAWEFHAGAPLELYPYWETDTHARCSPSEKHYNGQSLIRNVLGSRCRIMIVGTVWECFGSIVKLFHIANAWIWPLPGFLSGNPNRDCWVLVVSYLWCVYRL